jgi:mono/diheme cytochrome c family protein
MVRLPNPGSLAINMGELKGARMFARSIAWSALLIAAAASSAAGQEPVDPESGARLAAVNCNRCHGAADVLGGAPAFASIAARPSTTEDSLSVFLGSPHSTMPNIVLSWADRRDLIAYIMSLRP